MPYLSITFKRTNKKIEPRYHYVPSLGEREKKKENACRSILEQRKCREVELAT